MHPEREFIRQLRRKANFRNLEIALGIGDDCAVLRLPAGHEVLVTTDFSLENVHFRVDWQSAECIGHRCLSRGLSDIAAMGGRPVAAFLSLALPRKVPETWVNGFVNGLLRLARRHKVQLCGGDTSRSSAGVLADIAVVGSVKRGTSLLRSRAKPGDQIYVTGELGEAAAVLKLLKSGKIRRRDLFPAPRIEVGERLRANAVASAAIDISDGLSTDLSHICEESGVGAVVYAEKIPIHSLAQRQQRGGSRLRSLGGAAMNLALHGGEDYELLFTAPKSKRVPPKIAGVNITHIGEITRGKQMRLVREGKLEILSPKGWEHFGEK